MLGNLMGSAFQRMRLTLIKMPDRIEDYSAVKMNLCAVETAEIVLGSGSLGDVSKMLRRKLVDESSC